MKFGIYGGCFDKYLCGGYTYEESVLKGLNEYPLNHELFLFHRGYRDLDHHDKFRQINLNTYPVLKSPPMVLENAVFDHDIELFWFMVPFVFESIKIPFMVTVWDLQHRLQPFFPEVSVTGTTWETREQYYEHVLPRATYIITGTEEGRDEIAHFYRVHPSRIVVIPLPTPEFALNDTAPKNSVVIDGKAYSDYLFYPAKIWSHKNHAVLLHVLKVLEEKYDYRPHLLLTGSGAGNEDYLNRIANDLKVTDRIKNLGFVEVEQIKDIYKNALCLVYPSLFGPDNLPPLEAFALGCPVITADVPGATEQYGDAAILVNAVDEYAIAEKIIELRDNETLRQEMIARGRSKAGKYTCRGYVQKLADLLDEFSKYRRCWSNEGGDSYFTVYNPMQKELKMAVSRGVSSMEEYASLREMFTAMLRDMTYKNFLNEYNRIYKQFIALMLSSDFFYHELSAEEKKFVEGLIRDIHTAGAEATETYMKIIILILWLPAYKIPFSVAFPTFLLMNPPLQYFFTPPPLYFSPEDISGYFGYLKGTASMIASKLSEDPDNVIWREMAVCHFRYADMRFVYSLGEELIELANYRSRIAAAWFDALKCPRDYEFNPVANPRCRFAILAESIRDFADLSSILVNVRYLNKDGCDIGIFLCSQADEQALSGLGEFADKVTVLSSDVLEAVRRIREENPDFLLFVGDVSFSGGNYYLLSQVRLARAQAVGFNNSLTTLSEFTRHNIAGSHFARNDLLRSNSTETEIVIGGLGAAVSDECWRIAEESAGESPQKSLAGNGTVFHSGAKYYLISEAQIALWSELLHLTPEATLVLYPFLSCSPGGSGRQVIKERLRRCFEHKGIFANRLRIVDKNIMFDDLPEIAGIGDIYLDAGHFSHITPLLLSLASLKPCIVHRENHYQFNYGAAALTELGLNELIAHTPEHYLFLGKKLSSDREYRDRIRQRIRYGLMKREETLSSTHYCREISKILGHFRK